MQKLLHFKIIIKVEEILSNGKFKIRRIFACDFFLLLLSFAPELKEETSKISCCCEYLNFSSYIICDIIIINDENHVRTEKVIPIFACECAKRAR